MTVSDPTTRTTASPIVSPRSPTLRCPICLHEPAATDVATGDKCSHEHCRECLRRWTSTRPSSKCPVCQADIAVLRFANGEEESVLPFDQGASARGGDASTAAADHDPPDLGCLDHAFFAAEIIRLLRRAQTVQARLACSRHRRDQNDASQLMLEETIDALVARKGDMDYEVPFVPEEVLQELYSLDEIVCSISSGGLLPSMGFQPCGPTTATTTTNGVIRGDGGNDDGEEEHADNGGYSGLERRAEDRGAVMGRNRNTWLRPHCEDEVDDGDDDDGLDEYGAASQYEERFERMALSLTPGRKPTRRRSNAGGSKGNLMLAAAASSGSLSGGRWAGGPS